MGCSRSRLWRAATRPRWALRWTASPRGLGPTLPRRAATLPRWALRWVSFVATIDLGQHGAAAMANAADRDDFFGDVSDPEEDAVYDKKDQILSGALNDDDSFISGDHTESVTNSDCDSAEWKDIAESDLDSQTLSDLESQSFLPDGHDIALPSEDELRDNCGSDSDEGLIDRFEPQHLDFSND